MSPFELARHQVAVAGRVTDMRTGRAMSGAMVRIVTGPPAFMDLLAGLARRYGPAWQTRIERLDQTVTTVDGHFHFLDLPSGQYAVAVSHPQSRTRYGTRSSQVTVSRNADGTLKLTRLELTLPPTSLEGSVTRPGGQPLPMAEVQIHGGDERAFTDAQGRYVLSPLETGKRQVVASAHGFIPVTHTVAFAAPGASKTSDFTLTAVAS